MTIQRKKVNRNMCKPYLCFGECGMMLTVHCRAAETNHDETQTKNRRSSVSVHSRIPSIMSIKTVSDEDMATSSCRLLQAIPDGNLSM